MEIDALKNKLHTAIDNSNSIEMLSLMSKLLDQVIEKDEDELAWENTVTFQNELQLSLNEADRGEVAENKEVMERIKNRSWRTK
jgi:predicted transcriptional regulator